MARDIFLAGENGLFDLVLQEGDIAGDDTLSSCILVSLFTDARVGEDELPPEYTGRRGYFGDALLSARGDALGTGSRLWTLYRQKETEEVLSMAEEYAREALLWMVDEGLAESIAVEASAGGGGALFLSIRVKEAGRSSSAASESVWRVTFNGESLGIKEG